MTEPASNSKSSTTPRERSPSYPSIGIKEAIELAQKLWDKEKRTVVSPATAVKAWGYSGLSGASRAVLAAMRQYGLVDDVQDGVKLSELAIEVLHQPPGSSAKADAMAKAAMNPPLIKALAASHAEGSDDALKAYLITKKSFSEDAAKRLIKSFREALSLAGPQAPGYTGAEGEGGGAPDLPPPLDSGGMARQMGRPKVTVFSWPLSKGVTVEVRFTGDDVQASHLERLRQYLELAKDAVGSGGEG